MIDISISSLRFQIEIRLEPLHGLPLPPTPLIHTFEDSLIDHLFNFSSHDCIQAADRPRFLDRSQLLSLYSRFRAVPNSLTDDQKALVYATLCLSRFNQIKKEWEQEVGEGATPGMRREVAREDVTYFWKACTALRDWNRPSIFAMCKSSGVFVSRGHGAKLTGERRDTVLLSSVYNRVGHAE